MVRNQRENLEDLSFKELERKTKEGILEFYKNLRLNTIKVVIGGMTMMGANFYLLSQTSKYENPSHLAAGVGSLVTGGIFIKYALKKRREDSDRAKEVDELVGELRKRYDRAF